MRRSGYVFIVCLAAITSCPAWADFPYTTIPNKYDYGDAVGYGEARHETNEWQHLGNDWDEEWTQNTPDNFDDGVVWSTDGGSTFGSDLIRGQDVTFWFDMRRAWYGNHDYDQIKAWIDWDGDKVWHNTDEIILAERWWKGSTKIDDTHGIPPLPPNVDLKKTFTVTLTVPNDAALGTTWLRARVSCDHTHFGPPEDPPYTTPYGQLWQGETEDYELTVVPLPSGVILAGIGLLVAQRRLNRRA